MMVRKSTSLCVLAYSSEAKGIAFALPSDSVRIIIEIDLLSLSLYQMRPTSGALKYLCYTKEIVGNGLWAHFLSRRCNNIFLPRRGISINQSCLKLMAAETQKSRNCPRGGEGSSSRISSGMRSQHQFWKSEAQMTSSCCSSAIWNIISSQKKDEQ